MLALSLLVLGTAMLFAFLDKSEFPTTDPPKVAIPPRAAQSAAPTAAPPQAQPMQGVQPGVPQQGGQPQAAPPGVPPVNPGQPKQ
jgi:hypothetical protein